MKKFLETSKNELIAAQNIWDRVKAVLREKFIAIQPYLEKIEKSLINTEPSIYKNWRNKNKQDQE